MVCLSAVLPFNQISDDVEFMNALKNEIIFHELVKSVERLFFNPPGEITDNEISAPLADIDQGVNFSDEIYSGSISSCYYYDEDNLIMLT